MTSINGRVQRCDNGQPLLNAVLSDNQSNVASTGAGGYFYALSAYPGYTISAAFPSMRKKTITVDKTDIAAGWITICLDPDPDYVQPTGKPGGTPTCRLVEAIGATAAQMSTETGFLWPLLRFRDNMLVNSDMGRRMIAYYEDDEFNAELTRLTEPDPELRVSVLTLVMLVYPFVAKMMNADHLGEIQRSPDDVRFTEGMFEVSSSLAAHLRAATDNARMQAALGEFETELRRFVSLNPAEAVDLLMTPDGTR